MGPPFTSKVVTFSTVASTGIQDVSTAWALARKIRPKGTQMRKAASGTKATAPPPRQNSSKRLRIP